MKWTIVGGVAAAAALTALSAYAGSVSVETSTNVLVPGYPVNLGIDVVGNLPVTSLNGGQGASAATFWRGDGTWAATAGASSVGLAAPAWLTVTGSPVIGSGTITLSGTSEPAHQVLASPSGGTGPLAPRVLVPADLPSGTASLTAVDQVLSGGANVVAYNIGIEASGTYTVDCGKSPLQYLTNGGAFTLQAPVQDGDCHILVNNNGSAGSIIFAGFRVGANTGDPLTATNGSMFKIAVDRTNGIASYSVQALQ